MFLRIVTDCRAVHYARLVQRAKWIVQNATGEKLKALYRLALRNKGVGSHAGMGVLHESAHSCVFFLTYLRRVYLRTALLH